MQTMRAAVIHAFGEPLRIEERAVPTPGPGELLIKLAATGVCHTDLHTADGDWPVKAQLPLVPGHEGVGRIAAVGAGVAGFKEGDAAGIPWLHDACGACEYCRTGWETLCEQQRNTGFTVDGTYADYVLATADFVARIPDSADPVAAAPLICAGLTAYKALKETEAQPGEWVAVSGIGGLGHLAVQYAKALGLHVVALDIDPAKLEHSRSLGADAVVDAADPDAIRQVRRLTGGGAHGVVVSADAPAAFTQAVGFARRRGTVALTGLPAGTFPVPIFDVVVKRITVRGSIVGTRRDLAAALALAQAAKIKAEVTAEPLEAVNAVFDRLRKGQVTGRAVLTL